MNVRKVVLTIRTQEGKLEELDYPTRARAEAASEELYQDYGEETVSLVNVMVSGWDADGRPL